jgi:hypothetical protein
MIPVGYYSGAGASNVVSLVNYSLLDGGTTISVPVGAHPGDLLVLVCANSGGDSYTTPAPTGWTTLAQVAYGTLAYRVMQVGDSTFTINALTGMIALRGSVATPTVDVWSDTPGYETSPPVTFSFTTITPTKSADFLLLMVPVAAGSGNNTMSIADGTVLILDATTNYGSVALAVNYKSLTSNAPYTTTATVPHVGAGYPAGGFLAAFK